MVAQKAVEQSGDPCVGPGAFDIRAQTSGAIEQQRIEARILRAQILHEMIRSEARQPMRFPLRKAENQRSAALSARTNRLDRVANLGRADREFGALRLGTR